MYYYNKFLFYFILINFTVINISANENRTAIEITKRIGYEINPIHKNYFKLFPDIEYFKSAKLYQINEFFLQFELISLIDDELKYDTLKINKSVYENLKKIIDDYENIIDPGKEDEIYEIKWTSELLKIIRPELNISRNRSKIKFQTVNNDIVEGYLMWVDSSYVIMAPSDAKFRWYDVERNYKIYHFSEINKILKPGTREYLGREDIYLLNLKYFQNNSAFVEINYNDEYIVVPEFEKLLSEKEKTFHYEKSNHLYSIDELNSQKRKNYTVGIEIGNKNSYINTSKYVMLTIENEYIKQQIAWEGLKYDYPALFLEFSIFHNLRFGTSFNYYLNEFRYSKEQRSGINSKGYTLTIYLNYTPLTRNIYDFNLINDFEFSYKIGTIFGQFTNQIIINEFIDSQLYTNFEELNFNDFIFGGFAGVKASYFITNQFSIDLEGYGNLILPVKIENWNYRGISLVDESFDYSGLGFRLGFSYRI